MTTSINNPDELIVTIREGFLFTESIDFTSLKANTTLRGPIPPQLTESAMIKLEEIGSTVAAATTTITIGVIIAQACLYFGLKYLWNIMNLV